MLRELLSHLRQNDQNLLAYLAQVQAIWQEREPELHAFVPYPAGENARFARWQTEARALLAKYPNPAARPPLFGLPIGVKDIFYVAGWQTTAGSQLPPARLAGEEAAVVTRLRQAGALILGKTVTAEFAYFAPGATRNPHNLAHTPGGSSSGSAAGVAGGLCPVALGTQTIGSVNRPAAYCGVVGFKPSHGRVPTSGVIPVSPTWDDVGFFAHQPADIALLMGVIDATWRTVPISHKPLCFGLPLGPYLEQAEAVARAHLYLVAERLRKAGHKIIELPILPDMAEIQQKHLLVMAGEMARVHADWFGEFGELYAERTAVLIRQGQQYTLAQIHQAAQSQQTLAAELTRIMAQKGIDFWLTPSATGPAPRGLDSTGNPMMSLPWTHAGFPMLTLPTGHSAETGLPLGTQIVARWGEDERLVGVGSLFVG
jgi:Asp-tRNA(Asn)/Glu-tRNA(Gln) amidotransferase A subunit family amidase